MKAATATIIGSGPNGLSAAIVLAASGVRTTVLERNGQIGGGCSTAEITQPGFLHDLGSSTYPLGAASPFYGSLPLTIPWIQPHAAFAHPLDDGTAIVLQHSIEETIDQLDACDRKAYRSLIEPIVSNFAALVEEILGPILHIPRSPFVLARFGLSAMLPALSSRLPCAFRDSRTYSSSMDSSSDCSAPMLIYLCATKPGTPVFTTSLSLCLGST